MLVGLSVRVFLAHTLSHGFVQSSWAASSCPSSPRETSSAHSSRRRAYEPCSDHRESAFSAEIRRNPHSPLSTAECPKATDGALPQSTAGECAQCRAESTAQLSESTAPGDSAEHRRGPAMQLPLMLGTTRRIGGRRYAEAINAYICRPTHTPTLRTPTLTHSPTHTPTHATARTRAHTHKRTHARTCTVGRYTEHP